MCVSAYDCNTKEPESIKYNVPPQRTLDHESSDATEIIVQGEVGLGDVGEVWSGDIGPGLALDKDALQVAKLVNKCEQLLSCHAGGAITRVLTCFEG